MVSNSLQTTSDAEDGSMMQYGPQCGAPFYREELAKFLAAGYGDNVNVYVWLYFNLENSNSKFIVMISYSVHT